jgi:DNA modification methylase
MTTRILVGDVRARLADIPDASVHCCITSPPYFGLRDYGTAQWDGGDAGCDHMMPVGSTRGGPHSTITGGIDTTAHNQQYRSTCGKCGAVRIDNQIGIEPTLAEYIATLVDVFRGVRRVLRDDGVCFLNLGDSYAGGNGGDTKSGFNERYHGKAYATDKQSVTASQRPIRRRDEFKLKSKDLMMIPARVAIALQDDGWYLRSDIIWAKPNPMPESVGDRPTSAHEHVFLLSKSPRYFYDADAIREPLIKGAAGSTFTEGKTGINGLGRVSQAGREDNPAGRNKRNVWTIATTPYPGAHFATFPPKLVEPMILACTSEKGCCPACLSPWVRVVERIDTGDVHRKGAGWDTGEGAHGSFHRNGRAPVVEYAPVTAKKTLTWIPSCRCPDIETIPCTVLDPFGGAGTVGLVADRLGRDAILVELNPEYARMASARIKGDAPMFAGVEVA